MSAVTPISKMSVASLPDCSIRSVSPAASAWMPAGMRCFRISTQEGLCGYEIKNSGFTGFASGGSKALWLRHEQDDDRWLVICESAIDALSHAVLFPDPDDGARYASIGGKPNPQQTELIRAAIARMPDGSEVVAAMDAGADGTKLAGIVRQAFDLAGRDDLRFKVQEPFGYKDWNEELKEKRQTLSFPIARASSLDAG